MVPQRRRELDQEKDSASPFQLGVRMLMVRLLVLLEYPCLFCLDLSAGVLNEGEVVGAKPL